MKNDHSKVDKEQTKGLEEKEADELENASRRSFLKNTGIAAGGVVGGALLGGLVGNPFGSEKANSPAVPKEKEIIDYSETRQFFKRKTDFDVLSMATERIYPEDENGSGAIGLGVPYFIDKQLAGPWGRNSEDYMKKPFQKDEISPLNRGDIFIQGVRKINEVAQDEYDEAFPDLEEEQQIAILEKFEEDEVEMQNVSSAEFFGLMIQSTLEGCYADPMYGGNKNMEGWKMKEYPGPRMAHIDLVEEKEFVLLEPVSLKNQK